MFKAMQIIHFSSLLTVNIWWFYTTLNILSPIFWHLKFKKKIWFFFLYFWGVVCIKRTGLMYFYSTILLLLRTPSAFTLQATFIHSQAFANHTHTHTLVAASVAIYSSVSLPKDTVTCRLEEMGTQPLTFLLVDNQLYLLSESSH